MNKNVNVFIAVLLCALLCGGVIWLRMASEEKLGWNIQDTYSASPSYSSGASYSDATFVGPSSGGMMSVTSSRRSMRTRVASSYSYAGAYSSAATQPLTSHLSPLTSHLSPLTSNLSPLTSSPTGGGLYTTSSQTFKSFGGGNNAGVSMSGGSLVATNNYAQTSSAVSISSPISYTSLSRNNSANFQDALANGLSPEAVIASSMAMPTNGSLFGSYYTNDFTSSVDAYNPGSYSGIGYLGTHNRQNAPTLGGDDSNYINWLESYFGEGSTTLTEEQVRDLYVAMTGDSSFQNEEQWNAFWDWFMGKQSDDNFGWKLLPLSDAVLFILLLALAYVLYIYVNRKQIQTK